ncbi:MAG: hypothetical protein V4619_12610 [Bacteroidota bacterium]
MTKRAVGSANVVAPGFNPAKKTNNCKEYHLHGPFFTAISFDKMGRTYGSQFILHYKPRVETRGYNISQGYAFLMHV